MHLPSAVQATATAGLCCALVLLLQLLMALVVFVAAAMSIQVKDVLPVSGGYSFILCFAFAFAFYFCHSFTLEGRAALETQWFTVRSSAGLWTS